MFRRPGQNGLDESLLRARSVAGAGSAPEWQGGAGLGRSPGPGSFDPIGGAWTGECGSASSPAARWFVRAVGGPGVGSRRGVRHGPPRGRRRPVPRLGHHRGRDRCPRRVPPPSLVGPSGSWPGPGVRFSRSRSPRCRRDTRARVRQFLVRHGLGRPFVAAFRAWDHRHGCAGSGAPSPCPGSRGPSCGSRSTNSAARSMGSATGMRVIAIEWLGLVGFAFWALWSADG